MLKKTNARTNIDPLKMYKFIDALLKETSHGSRPSPPSIIHYRYFRPRAIRPIAGIIPRCIDIIVRFVQLYTRLDQERKLSSYHVY